jgi:hypothetical protein
MQNQGRGSGRMAMGNLVLSVVGSGSGGSKKYSSINPDFLLPRHCYLFDTNFESPSSGPMSQCLLWLAEMDTAFAASCLASAGILTPEAIAYFSEEYPGHWTSPNPSGGPSVKVNVCMEGRCKENIDKGGPDGNDCDVNEGGGNMVCNGPKDAINYNRLPRFLVASIWLLSEDANDALGIRGQQRDSQVWQGYQRMDDGLGPLLTMKWTWAMEKQPRVAKETEDGQWTMSNDNRERDNKGKKRGYEKSRSGSDIRNHTMDNDCLSSKKGRCFLCGPVKPVAALVSELSWRSNKCDCVAICSCCCLSRPEKKDKSYVCTFYFHFFG